MYTGGYGSRFLNVLRCNRDNIEFPLTLGREFSGTIIQKGMGCSSHIKTGDLVFGVVPPWRMGCHAEYVVVSESCVCKPFIYSNFLEYEIQQKYKLFFFDLQVSKKPDNISVLESGGVLYAGLTAWSGLFISGLLGGVEGALTAHGGGRGKRVLVLGAAGGVGTSAIQILNAENVSVIASCSTDAIEIVKRLGVDHVIDYTNQEQINDFSSFGPYDIILDCTGQGPEYAEKFNWSYKNYVTFSSPFLKNIDNNGLGLGMYENLKDIIDINTKSIITKKGVVKWGYFLPAPNGITYLSNLIKRKKVSW